MNPDTNSQMFDKLPVNTPLAEGDLFKDSVHGWKATEHAGREVVGWGGGTPIEYFRRKPQQYRRKTEGTNMNKWKSVIDEPPKYSVSVVLTDRPDAVQGAAVNAWMGYNQAYGRPGWEQGPTHEPRKATHWAELPTEVEPPKAKPIILNESGINREVKFDADGAVVVGCVRVDPKVFDEIVARRAKAIGK